QSSWSGNESGIRDDKAEESDDHSDNSDEDIDIAILDLALQFDNACTAKDDLRKAYEKCNDIPQENDSDLRLTPIMRPASSTRVETSHSTQNPVRIIPGLAGIVQEANLLKQRDILLGLDGAVMSTQEYMKKVVEDVGEVRILRVGRGLAPLTM
ncbi:hypothetical protein Tco_0794105, partial [Tanacetum coccineum]